MCTANAERVDLGLQVHPSYFWVVHELGAEGKTGQGKRGTGGELRQMTSTVVAFHSPVAAVAKISIGQNRELGTLFQKGLTQAPG
jgi:hypothetical protein